jgi:hypothetical protein
MTKIETIYLIHHSHTDVGYTHDQPVVWEMQLRFIDEALALAEKYANHQSDGAFRWTVETTVVLRRWLERASPEQIERFTAMERAGRIEVTGMFANITPLFDTDQLIESLQTAGWLRQRYGFDIRHAMNCDVNGENWPLVDLLLDAGIEGFSMAINTHFGGAMQPRPYPFLWEGPSGRKIATMNGWTYDKGYRIGIGRDAEALEQTWWPLIEQYLAEINYPLPILMMQSFHPFGDNGSAYDFTPFIDAWNGAGKSPRIVMAIPRIWWEAVKAYHDQLEILRGDWTDFWNFGSISSAREQAMNRVSRTRLRAADVLHAAAQTLAAATSAEEVSRPQWADGAYHTYREPAWEALHLWDEHTWGADYAVRETESEDTYSQWYHKAHYAYQARSLSLLLQRDGLAELARYVQRNQPEDILILNPLPWARQLSGPIRPANVRARGLVEDGTAGRHHLDRQRSYFWQPEDLTALPAGSPALLLRPTQVPGLGYTVVSRQELEITKPIIEQSESAVVENQRYRLTFDRGQDGIVSLYDKQLGWEWVDPVGDYPLHGFVHEQVADTAANWPRHRLFVQNWDVTKAEIPAGWQTGWWASRRRPAAVVSHRVYKTLLGYAVVQQLEAPGCQGLLTQRVFLPDEGDYIDCESSWTMGLTDHPEATYLLFPFNIPDAAARFDLGGQAVVPGEEQLPGVCRDYFTTQGWVDFSNGERGITVALPENPMIQLGNFHFGDYQSTFDLERPMLLGWVTNNYWETNFRAHQPGRVQARYRLYPYAGAFDEGQAHRRGLEAAHFNLIAQPLGEPAIQAPALPPTGALLRLPAPPILSLHAKPARSGQGWIIRLLNASDRPQTAQLGSALLKIEAARRCDLFETPVEELAISGGMVLVEIPARRVAVLHLALAPVQ